MDNTIAKIKENWFFILFVGSIVIWYSQTNFRLNQVEARQDEQDLVTSQISEIITDVAVIKANVEFIKQEIQ